MKKACFVRSVDVGGSNYQPSDCIMGKDLFIFYMKNCKIRYVVLLLFKKFFLKIQTIIEMHPYSPCPCRTEDKKDFNTVYSIIYEHKEKHGKMSMIKLNIC